MHQALPAATHGQASDAPHTTSQSGMPPAPPMGMRTQLTRQGRYDVGGEGENTFPAVRAEWHMRPTNTQVETVHFSELPYTW